MHEHCESLSGGGLDRSAQFTASSSAFEASAAPFGNPFTTSVSPGNVSVDGAHLGTVGGDSIFREINEKDSLSKVSLFHMFFSVILFLFAEHLYNPPPPTHTLTHIYLTPHTSHTRFVTVLRAPSPSRYATPSSPLALRPVGEGFSLSTCPSSIGCGYINPSR